MGRKGEGEGEEGGLREGDLKCHIKPNHDGKLLRTGTKSRRSLARVELHCVRAFSSVLTKRRDPLSADGASGGTNAFSAVAIRRKIAALAADPSPSRERSASCQAVILDVIRSAALQHFGNVGSAAHKNARKMRAVRLLARVREQGRAGSWARMNNSRAGINSASSRTPPPPPSRARSQRQASRTS